MDNNKIQKISHYIIVLLLVILWFIMMFFPENMDTMNFKIFFTLSVERNTFLCKKTVKQKNLFVLF